MLGSSIDARNQGWNHKHASLAEVLERSYPYQFFLITPSTNILSGFSHPFSFPPTSALEYIPYTIWDSCDKHTTQHHHFPLWMYLNPCPNHQPVGSPAVVVFASSAVSVQIHWSKYWDSAPFSHSPGSRTDLNQVSLILHDWCWSQDRVTLLPLPFLSPFATRLFWKDWFCSSLTPRFFRIRAWVPNSSY